MFRKLFLMENMLVQKLKKIDRIEAKKREFWHKCRSYCGKYIPVAVHVFFIRYFSLVG